MGVLRRIQELFAPPVFADEEQTRQAGLLNVMLLASMLINLVGGLPAIFLEGASRVRIFSTSAGFVLQLIVLVLLHRRRTRLASLLLCLGFWLTITFFSFVSGGISSPLLSFNGVIVLSAGLLLGSRVGAGLAGLSIASVITMYYFQERSLLPGFIPLAPASVLLDQIAILMSIAVVLYLALRSLSHVLERARAGERAQMEANRELTALRASMEDHVADLERVHKSLRDSETLYHALVENLPQSVYYQDQKGKVIFANQHYCDEYRRPLREIVGKTAFDLHPPELAAQYQLDDQRVMERGEILEKEEEHQVVGGEKYYVQVVKIPTYDSSGRVVGVQGIYWDITERKRAENVLHQSRRELEKLVEARTVELANERNLLRTLIDTLPDVIYVKDSEGRFILANVAQARLLGAGSVGDLVGQKDSDFYPQELSAKYDADDQAVIQSGQPLIGIEEPNTDPTGERKWLTTTKVPFRDHNGKIVGLVGLGRDITRQKQVEEKLRESEARFRKLFEASPDAVILFDPRDPHWAIVDCNQVACQMNGYTREELIGQPIHMLNLTSGDAAARASYLERLRREGTLHYESYHRRKDGTLFLIEISNTLISLPGRELVLGIDHDITERKQAEEALAKERNLLRTLIEVLPDYIYVKDAESRFIITNIANARALGIEATEQAIGKSDLDFYPKEEALQYYLDEQALVRSGQPLLNKEEVSVDGTGKRRWTLTTKMPVRDNSGQVIGLAGVGRDITERKKLEDALRQSEARFRKLFEASPDSVVLLDAGDSRWPIVDCNQVACQMNGYTREELIGQSIDLLNASATDPAESTVYTDPAERAASLDRLRDGGILHFETRHRHKDGRIFPIEVATTIISVGNKELVLGIDRDITERKRAEESLRRLGTHDSLTGLYNRAFFEEELKRLEASRLFPVSIVMADVDALKATNDREGHAAGDELLRRTAIVLSAAFRAEDIIARIGGDEFAVLLPQTTAEAVGRAVDRCRAEIRRQKQVPGKPSLGLSLGAATAQTSENLTRAVQVADGNMYQDKAARKNLSLER